MRAIRVVTNPDGCEIRESGRLVARFTDGAQTVTMRGPRRSFRNRDIVVSHDVWVRLMPAPYAGDHEDHWLEAAMAANEDGVPDVLAIAMQYLEGVDPIEEGDVVIAGPAQYGPSRPNAPPDEGSDFNDFLGISWDYPAERPQTDPPEERQFGCLDCSGYVRMVFGYRTHRPNSSSVVTLSKGIRLQALPRRAYQIFSSAPGVLLTVRTKDTQPGVTKLRPGDLTFFKADDEDLNEADHVGIFLGADLDSGLRFVSSRKKANGPMFHDVGGGSLLTGRGLYARSFVGARRL